MIVHLLSGGAAQGLVAGIANDLRTMSNIVIAASFGAIGTMQQRLLDGDNADLVIFSRAMVAELIRDGHLITGSEVDIGVIYTGLAVRSGDPIPPVATAADLRDALRRADAIYFPDPGVATAGIHFAKVMHQLGVAAELAPRFRTYPNGHAAMTAMAAHPGGSPIGCTQITEILGVDGVAPASLLPHEFELATVYTAALTSRAAQPAAARRLADALAGQAAAPLRERLGFAPAR